MAINIGNTNYNGEVLESLLALAATGNELVERGLIHIEPNISYKFSIPRLKTGTMLQKHKEQPQDGDSKGNFNYSEKELNPVDFMAFTTFNPRSFERIWRIWQPKGPLVFAELPEEGQNALLAELAKQVKFELGYHFINGVYAESGDTNLFNGIIYRMAEDVDVIVVSPNKSEEIPASGTGETAVPAVPAVPYTNVLERLKALRKKIPTTLRASSGLRILMSIADFDAYDDELTARHAKNSDDTEVNAKRYKGITLEPLANWPDGLLVATICGMGYDTNLWAGVNLQDDMDVIKIGLLENAGERYFFKMLMKADTQIAFGEEVVVMDSRQNPQFTVAPEA
ncbi:hypothetical protein FACS1894199_11520 [Bacteroidia bacterium]|nr:hypothetical protein FACS1894199_11520 [Bacteroidia bacterium]